MKVERFFYGMQTGDGKIYKLKTPGVDTLLTSKSQEFIRTLKPTDSRKYLWFRSEQTVAYPVVYEVADRLDGGRTWVQNQTYLVNIHEFLSYMFDKGRNPFELLIYPEMDKFPEVFEALNV